MTEITQQNSGDGLDAAIQLVVPPRWIVFTGWTQVIPAGIAWWPRA